MKTSLKIVVLFLVLSVLSSCSKDDPENNNELCDIHLELPVYGIDYDEVTDIELLNINSVTVINSEEQQIEFFKSINVKIPLELSQIDYEKNAFLFIAQRSLYGELSLEHFLIKNNNGYYADTKYIYSLTQNQKKESWLNGKGFVTYFSGIVVDKMDNLEDITLMCGSTTD